jgi:hypothetical protein
LVFIITININISAMTTATEAVEAASLAAALSAATIAPPPTGTVPTHPYKFIPLAPGSHIATRHTNALIKEAGGEEGVARMTMLFYSHVFKSADIDKFIRNRDDPHGKRFAKFICEKFGAGKL